MIRITHIADLHLDAPFADCTPSERTARREEQRAALRYVCDSCKKEKTDILLVAGDLFDSDFIRSDTPSFVAECFACIPQTRVFIAPGNHDPYTEHSPYRAARFPDNVHIFTSEKLECREIPELNTAVYGFGFNSSRVRSCPLNNTINTDGSKINILLAHGDLDTASAYCEIKSDILSAGIFDYAALGHIHKPSGFLRFGRTVCAYSGSLVPMGFDECGERGMIAGEIAKGNIALKYVSIGDRRYEIIKINAEESTDEELLLSEISQRCADFTKKCALRIVLEGNVREKTSLTVERLRAHLPATPRLELVDNTVVIPDMSRLLEENSLRGEFCRKIAPLLKAEDETERRKAALALKYGLDALGN